MHEFKNSETSDTVVFITGMTGAIGSRLVAEMLRSSSAQLRLLVRAADLVSATARARNMLRYWGIDPDEPQVGDRVQVFVGDICKPNMGMERQAFEILANEVTHIIHAATDIKLNLPLQQARYVSVQGTRHVVELARACQRHGCFQGFSFISTIEVAGDYGDIIYEEFLSDYKRNFLNSYEIAKSETEEWLKDQITDDLPVTIYRASMVVGDSENGKSSRFGSFYYLFSDLVLEPPLPIMPGSDKFLIDTVPVDFVARAISCLYDDPAAIGQIYHLTAGLDDPLTVPDLCRRAAPELRKHLQLEIRPPRFVSPRGILGLSRMLHKVSVGRVRRNLERQLIFLEFFVNRWQLDNSKLRAAVASHGLTVPHLIDHLPTLVSYYLSSRRGRGGIPIELANIDG